MSQIYILYHAACHDGFGAAYAAWKKFGDSARYIATSDRVRYPEFIPEGSEVYLLDFAFGREVIDELRAKMHRVMILDHHVTIQKDLEWLPDTIFDMHRSGAVIAWEYFHDSPAPLFLRYIQDHDIFTNLLPFTREITLYNFSLEFDFPLWDEKRVLFDEIEKNGGMQADSLPVNIGKTIGDYRDIIVEKMVNRLLQWKVIAGYRVPVVNAPREFGWDMTRMLLEKYPNAPFAAFFTETERWIEWSLRSREFDVSAIAKAFWWGWHVRAAGFFRAEKTEDEVRLPES